MSRIVTAISGAFVAIATFLATAPAAFALIVRPPSDGPVTSPATSLVHHATGGVSALEVGLIVAGGIVVLTAVAFSIVRLWHRASPRPALSH